MEEGHGIELFSPLFIRGGGSQGFHCMASRKGLLLWGKEIRKTRLPSWYLQLLGRIKDTSGVSSLWQGCILDSLKDVSSFLPRKKLVFFLYSELPISDPYSLLPSAVTLIFSLTVFQVLNLGAPRWQDSHLCNWCSHSVPELCLV